MARLLEGCLAERSILPWTVPQITERVVDCTDPAAFPEMAKAREHAARLREVEARNGC
jgi:hypothetical protein